MIRQIIHIDPTLCDGCGLCVSHCTFHAIEIVNGLAQLRGDEYCDGAAHCDPICPQGAISLGVQTHTPFDPFAIAKTPIKEQATRHRSDSHSEPKSSTAAPTDQKHLDSRATRNPTPSAIFRRRLAICCSATQCGRLCHRLIKQPGKTGVFCVDIQTNEITDLYTALSSPTFHCPEGKF